MLGHIHFKQYFPNCNAYWPVGHSPPLSSSQIANSCAVDFDFSWQDTLIQASLSGCSGSASGNSQYDALVEDGGRTVWGRGGKICPDLFPAGDWGMWRRQRGWKGQAWDLASEVCRSLPYKIALPPPARSAPQNTWGVQLRGLPKAYGAPLCGKGDFTLSLFKGSEEETLSEWQAGSLDDHQGHSADCFRTVSYWKDAKRVRRICNTSSL